MALVGSKDWAWLPRDILDLILHNALEFHDFIRVASVCKPWRSTALHADSVRQGKQHLIKFYLLKTCRGVLPMLMTPTNDNCDNERNLYSVMDGRVCKFALPMPFTRRFTGSSKGWLFTVDESMTITLINPFLNKAVVLPKFQVPDEDWQFQIDDQTDHQYFIVKTILLSGNTRQLNQERGENTGVLLIYGPMKRLAYLKPEAKAWEIFELNVGIKTGVFSDIICYKGEAYAVSSWSALVWVDVTRRRRWKIVVEASDDCANRTYLVESKDGDLLLVQRYVDLVDDKLDCHMTERFEVYKLSMSDHGNLSWVQIKSIGEQALFLGDNCSLSVSTRDFPNCKPNCIYYVDNYYEIHNCFIQRGFDDDSGIYNMEDGSITRHYTPHPSVRPSLPSIWVVPKFNP